MVFILKALAGAVTVGGVITPISLLKSGDFVTQERGSDHFLEDKNLKVQKVLKWLGDKNCQLIQNPENANNWSNAIYACEKQDDGQANFYYVGPENSFITETESNLIRKVSSVNYLGNKETETALLLLTLDDREIINWSVTFGSGWQYFNNVKLSEQCKVSTKEIGGDDLLCKLVDLEKISSVFFYRFAVFS